jgi:hypothetical protein
MPQAIEYAFWSPVLRMGEQTIWLPSHAYDIRVAKRPVSFML